MFPPKLGNTWTIAVRYRGNHESLRMTPPRTLPISDYDKKRFAHGLQTCSYFAGISRKRQMGRNGLVLALTQAKMVPVRSAPGWIRISSTDNRRCFLGFAHYFSFSPVSRP